MGAENSVDLRYREYDLETLQVLKASLLTQIKAIEGVGQSDSISGRNMVRAAFKDVNDELKSVMAAIKYLSNQANNGNTGFASRLADFGGCGNDW